MLRVNGEAFYRAVVALQTFRQLVETHDKDGPWVPGVQKLLLSHSQTLHAQLEILQAPVTGIANARLIKALQKDDCSLKEAAQLAWDVNSRLRDELSGMSLFCLEAEKRKYFDPAQPLFGDKILEILPLIAPDVESAGKCLAVHQGTAAVFHLMRVMEAVLKELAKLLDIPYAPSWESYLNQINTRITEKHARKKRKWKKHEPFFRGIYGDLQAVKIAWRNPTMHIIRYYSVDEAEDIFRAVRAFVQHITAHISDHRAAASAARSS